VGASTSSVDRGVADAAAEMEMSMGPSTLSVDRSVGDAGS
jgi:hypothetical protein